ncbi:PucR family transcriptional regulator [Streptomyces sp. So13.3]|uniref:PucR family transcriptional regulator n=1 Tax=Streptomyces TaxID=1883 RepID=UPI00110741A3|nr:MULTISPECIES: helix-turn-helix domain-containing protein [Streptomyces]MCZ4103096.1 helix-turn-helix domain-containing protein [Streptomyces sp. H39-C1]QNA76573.1 PucR family transcriptional regulator [Streptomyces sp. So13.3]
MRQTQELADEPFSRIPPELAHHLRPFLDAIRKEVVAAIQAEIPEYDRPTNDTYTKTIHTGVELGLNLLLDRLSAPGISAQEVIGIYRGIGRGEAREGRSLDSFQGALRIGARISWRRIVSLADADVLPREVLGLLGEAALVHIDEIATATSAGYAEAQLHLAGELQRRRLRLFDMLIAERPPTEEAIRDLAHAAHWPVPTSLAVVVVDHHWERETLYPILPPGFLARFDQRPGCIVVPDPGGPGRTRAVDSALQGHRAALGPTVQLTEGARSLRWAMDALTLARRDVLPGGEVVRCSENLATMLLFQDEALVDALAERHLGPLERMRPPYRARLADTLLCWLQCSRNANEVAGRLGIHPQTVRYRLRQLDELFGDRLQDPDARFEMELALRVQQLR